MGFWSNAFKKSAGLDLDVVANANGPGDHNPGDADGYEFQRLDWSGEARATMPFPVASAWDGWPAEWSSPAWQSATGLKKLVDIAWACLDLNSRVLASMPVYRMTDGRIVRPEKWMNNPDPAIYTSWQEFAKQLFWDFQMGEAFVMPFSYYSDGYPSTFRVIPPYLMHVDIMNGQRTYKLGGEKGVDVTDKVLHIRYSGTTADARGKGPLDVAAPRAVTIGLLQKYVDSIAESGGIPQYWIGVDRIFRDKQEAHDVLDTWVETRKKYAGQPAILSKGAELHQAQQMSTRDMALMELSQFNESRIAILLGVPPFLVGLAGAAGSLTYSNVSDLFDFHDRSSLRPMAHAVMAGLSEWATPWGQSVEINRDDYTRLPLDKRMAAYKIAIEMGILSPEEVRVMERYTGGSASSALSGVQALAAGNMATPAEPTGPLPTAAATPRPTGGMN